MSTVRAFVEAQFPHGAKSIDEVTLKRPNGESVEGWWLVQEGGMGVIYIGDRRIDTTPVAENFFETYRTVDLRLELPSELA